MNQQLNVERLREAIAIMEVYLRLRLELRDWHGVMDAAADLRELEARLQVVHIYEQRQ